MHLISKSATHCNITTHCNTLQHTAAPFARARMQVPPERFQERFRICSTPHTATRCNTLQHTATRCNTLLNLQNEPECRRPNHISEFETHSTLQHTTPHLNTLQRTLTLCNTLQHTATLFTRAQTQTPPSHFQI